MLHSDNPIIFSRTPWRSSPRFTHFPWSPVSQSRQLTHIPPGQNCRQFGRRHFQILFLNKNDKISIQISLKFTLRCPIYNKPALVQVMSWHRTGDKPLPEAMMILCIDAYMRHCGGSVNKLCFYFVMPGLHLSVAGRQSLPVSTFFLLMTVRYRGVWVASWWESPQTLFVGIFELRNDMLCVASRFYLLRIMARFYLRRSIIYDVPLPKSRHYLWLDFLCNVSINPFHKSQNAPIPYTTMHHFVTEMRTYVHISVTEWCIMGYLSDALWDLWDGFLHDLSHELCCIAMCWASLCVVRHNGSGPIWYSALHMHGYIAYSNVITLCKPA